jgi:hypothetical protein
MVFLLLNKRNTSIQKIIIFGKKIFSTGCSVAGSKAFSAALKPRSLWMSEKGRFQAAEVTI